MRDLVGHFKSQPVLSPQAQLANDRLSDFVGQLDTSAETAKRGLSAAVRNLKRGVPPSIVIDELVALGVDEGKLDTFVKVIQAVIQLVNGNTNGVKDLACMLGSFNPARVKAVFGMVKDYGHFVASKKKSVFDGVSAVKSGVVDMMHKEKATKSEATKMKATDLFDMFDKDNSGTMSFDEFGMLVKYHNLQLTPSHLHRLFAKADKSENNELDKDEFLIARKDIEAEISAKGMTHLGLSDSMLARFFILSVLNLVLLFVFIFVGISAFTTGSSFSAVINSIFPAVAGLGLGSKDEAKKARNTNDDQLNDIIDKAMAAVTNIEKKSVASSGE